MNIKIKADTFEKKEVVEISNDNLNNLNFVDFYIGDKEYTFSINDLSVVINAFNDYREKFNK